MSVSTAVSSNGHYPAELVTELAPSLPQHLVEAGGKARRESNASELNSDGILAAKASLFGRRGLSGSTAVSPYTEIVDPITGSPNDYSSAELASPNQTMGDSPHEEQVV
jgi:hypothetical protein